MIKKFNIFFLISILFVLSLSCELGNRNIPEIGSKAIAFKLKDINGKNVQLSDFKNKAVLIEFWATWCQPCKESAPEIDRLYEKFNDKDFVILGISLDEGRNALHSVTNFVHEYRVSYPVLIDYDKSVSKAYAVTHIPSLYLLDKEHKIVNKYVGFIPGLSDILAKEIEGLLIDYNYNNPPIVTINTAKINI